jgi:hypothetical protein
MFRLAHGLDHGTTLNAPPGTHMCLQTTLFSIRAAALCWFKVCLHVEKRETIVLKEGRTESDVNVKAWALDYLLLF